MWAAPARAESRPGAARWAVSGLFFLNGALFATWASRIPAVQAERALNPGQLGLALLAMALGAMVAMPVAGVLSARIGSDKVCRIAALIYCGILPGLVLAPGLPVFALCLFGFGAGHGALDVAMNAQAVAVEKRYRRPIMSSFHALWSTGGLTGAALGGLLAARGAGLLAHFLLAAGLLGAGAILTLPHLLEAGRPAVGALGGETAAPTFSWPSRGLLALGAVALCIMLGEGAMADWSAVYLRSTLDAREGLATAGYAAFSIAMAAGRYWGDYLCARFGAVNLVRAGGALAAGGLLLALVSAQAPLALAGFACVGLGFATIVPMVFSAAGHGHGVAPGIAVASVTTLGYLGFLLGPPVIGFGAEWFGLRAALGLVVGTSLLAVALAPSLRAGSASRH